MRHTLGIIQNYLEDMTKNSIVITLLLDEESLCSSSSSSEGWFLYVVSLVV